MNGNGSWLRRLDDSGVPLLIARVILAATFIYMGSMKFGSPFEFLKQVRQYQMLPETPAIYLNTTAIVLPWLEIVAGVALLIGLRVRGAAVAIALMLLVFTRAILIRGLRIHSEQGGSFFDVVFDCGCGSGPVTIWIKLLGNVGFFVLAIVVLISRSRRFCLAAWFDRKPGVAIA